MKMSLIKNGLILGAVVTGASACNIDEKKDQRVIPENHVSGSFMVEILNETEGDKKVYLSESAQPIAAEFGCSLEGPTGVQWEQRDGTLPMTLSNSYHIKFIGCDLSTEQTDQALMKFLELEGVQSAEAEAVVKISVTENDPYKRNQYYHTNIKRNEACDLENTSGKPVVVAVVDSGVQFNHPDLVDRFYKDEQGNVVGANFVGKGSNRSPDRNWDDSNGHGTHVAGLIAATANNGQGIAGVASCKNVLIMPIRVMGQDGRGSSIEIDRGIQWAAAKGADIINLSLGSNSYSYQRKTRHRKNLYEALAEQGVIVFAAAGNDGFENGSVYQNSYIYSYPASYDNVIAVGATDQADRLTDFSVYGERIDIAAPGDQTLSTYPGSSYKYLSGTSMATPIAAGAYAMALSQVRSAREILFHDEVIELLNATAQSNSRFTSRQISSGGLINAMAMVTEMRNKFPVKDDDDSQRPTNPIEPNPEQPDTPEEPAPAPAPQGFNFVGFENGMSADPNGLNIKVTGWPEGTYRIYLYYINGREWFPRSFTSLGRENLQGDVVVTPTAYVFYGTKYLVAEAVDAYGRRLDTMKVLINGL